MHTSTIFSAMIHAGAGFESPVPIEDIPGWTVDKQHQTGVYKIIHNLGLTNPLGQMHIVATPWRTNTFLTLTKVDSDYFVISSTAPNGGDGGDRETDFMFIATYYPYRR